MKGRWAAVEGRPMPPLFGTRRTTPRGPDRNRDAPLDCDEMLEPVRRRSQVVVGGGGFW